VDPPPSQKRRSWPKIGILLQLWSTFSTRCGTTRISLCRELGALLFTFFNQEPMENVIPTYNSFDDVAAASAADSSGGHDMTVFNMGKVESLQGMRGCRRGLGMYVGSDDHGNPHIDVMQGSTKLAKVFMQPQVALDPSVQCRLSKEELDTVLGFMSSTANLEKYKDEWNRVHGQNKAAQQAVVER